MANKITSALVADFIKMTAILFGISWITTVLFSAILHFSTFTTVFCSYALVAAITFSVLAYKGMKVTISEVDNTSTEPTL